MCAIGRALMSRPKMILLDEPSMGLAPQIVEEIFEIVKDLNEKEGVSFLLAEQNTHMALRLRALRLHSGEWPGGDGRRRQGAGRERGRQGILPRHRRRQAQVVPRRQALPQGRRSAGWRNFGRCCRPDVGRTCPITTTLSKPAIRPSASATLFARPAAQIVARAMTAPGWARHLAGRRSEIGHLARGAGEAAGAAQVRSRRACKRKIRRSAASMSRRPARPSACKCRRGRSSSRKGTAPISAVRARAVRRRLPRRRHRAQFVFLSSHARRLHSGGRRARARLRGHSRRRRQYRAAARGDRALQAGRLCRHAGLSQDPARYRARRPARTPRRSSARWSRARRCRGSLRDELAQRGVAVLQCYAVAEAGVIAYESEAREGMIVSETVDRRDRTARHRRPGRARRGRRGGGDHRSIRTTR